MMCFPKYTQHDKICTRKVYYIFCVISPPIILQNVFEINVNTQLGHKTQVIIMWWSEGSITNVINIRILVYGTEQH